MCVIFFLGFLMKYFIDMNNGLWLQLDFWVKIATIINAFTILGVIGLCWQVKAEHERSRREKAVDLLLKWNDSLKKETSSARKIVQAFSIEQCRSLVKQEKFIVSRKDYDSILILMEKKEAETIKKTDTAKEAEIVKKADTVKEAEIVKKADTVKEAETVKKADTVKEAETVKETEPKINYDTSDKVQLSAREVSKLRWLVISYLNLFESILVAWQYSVADREIIEAQFSYLFDLTNGCDALSTYRQACGGENSYPAIEVFSAHVQEQKHKKLINKKNVA